MVVKRIMLLLAMYQFADNHAQYPQVEVRHLKATQELTFDHSNFFPCSNVIQVYQTQQGVCK
ncbi:hypothetical protein [Candidatus Enterovibrio altilux]|uniref:Uncharacterized protein n=1 Tax=Candidatus Enterovibrio altilux TaxID=1927128 RepID=A0A291B713_9GAMM|nr:hypothetical protein [Candidatus Enterovibrio luxaltus]ATF08792.1 hypothetical protein BTN50_0254 [Candidatus Enterovibrio luxaltus]